MDDFPMSFKEKAPLMDGEGESSNTEAKNAQNNALDTSSKSELKKNLLVLLIFFYKNKNKNIKNTKVNYYEIIKFLILFNLFII